MTTIKPPVPKFLGKAKVSVVGIGSRLLNSLPSGKGLPYLLSWALVGIFVIATGYYLLPREQIYIVSADTKSIVVETNRNSELQWVLSEVTLCLAKDGNNTEFSEESILDKIASFEQNTKTEPSTSNNSQCDSSAFETVGPLNDAIITWPQGMRVGLTLGADEIMQIEVINEAKLADFTIAGKIVPDHSLLFIPASTFEANGTLVLSGNISIGQNMTVGSLYPLQSGSYEIRERLKLFGWAGAYQLVGKDSLIVGDKVEVKNTDTNKSVEGRVFFSRVNERPHVLAAVMTTQPEPSALSLQRGDVSGNIEPDWILRIQTDAWPAVLTTLLGLLGASLGIVRSFQIGGGQEEHSEQK